VTTVGRLRELELLGRVVAAAEGGAGGVALVEGDPGIGKTHVLEALAGRTVGSTVLRGRAWEEGGAPPSWPWREVVRSLGATVDWEDTPDRYAVYEQVIAALRDAAAVRPLLVLLDDLHAADADTLALTRLVARSIQVAPVAVVIAARPSQRLAPLARDCVRVALGPLSPAEISMLADQTAPFPLSGRAREDIARIAEGNPLAAHELALAADRAGNRVAALPQQLRDAVLERVAALSDPVRELLHAAAVLGRQFDLEDVADLIECGLDEVLDRLGPPTDGRIVAAVSGAQWQFSHQVVRDAIYESMPVQTRLELHAAAAARLAAPGSHERLDEQARHLIAAVPLVDRDHAVHIAARAAAHASRSLAFGAAADTLQSALALTEARPSRLGLLLELGDAQLRGGRVIDAWETFEEAGALARSANDTDASTRALLGRTERVPSTSHAGELAGRVERALEESSSDKPSERIRLLARYARLQAAAGATALAAPAAIEAVEAARSFGDDVLLSEVLTVRHVTLGGPDDVEAAKEISDELVAVAARSADPERILEAAMAQLVDQLSLGDVAGVDRTLERYRQIAGATGLPRHRFFAESRRAMRAFLAGRLAEGEAMLDRAYRIGLDIEEPDTEAVFHGARVMVLADLTDSGGVRADAEAAEAVAAATGESWLLVFAAYLRSSAGERDAAARLLDQALAPDLASIARDRSWLMMMCMAAYVVARAPDLMRARPLYDLLLPYRGRIVVNAGAVTFGGVVDHYLGLLAGALQEPENARGHLDDAAAIYQRLGATLFLARARQSRDELASEPEVAPRRPVRRAVLRRSRSGWECGYAEAKFRVAHMVGLQHLARLLVNAGAEVHVLQLAAPGADRALAPQSRQALLDPQAKAAYRGRIAELREDLDEAESNNDFERADRLRAELDMIIEELRGAVGLGGRDRSAANETERARVAVRKAITAALDRLAEHDTAFAQHLRIHIRTGIYCRYEPDATNPIDWEASP
jgi:AAA ATPase domain